MTQPNGNGGPTVEFTVKEYLARIETKLDTLDARIVATAGKEELETERRRIDELERLQTVASAVSHYKRWLFASFGAVALNLGINIFQQVAGLTPP